MNILITGSAGYIGNSIFYKFHKKYDVVKLTRQICDLTNNSQVNNFFKNKRFDVVIHCAVKGGNRLLDENYSIMDDNLKMYYNLLNHSDKFNKFIHIGSGAEFSKELTPYGLSKSVISKSISCNENFYNLRVFAVFDENELDRRFIKSSIVNYITKKPIVVHANKKMDFFYMNDFLKVLDYFLSQETLPKNIDCVYKNKKTLFEIAQIINSLSDYQVPIEISNNNSSDDYVGEFNPILNDFNLSSLENAIDLVYKKLKI